MSQYKTGTVSITNGSPIVTGSGTSWLANVSIGDSFKIKSENVVYSVASVDSDTQITLTISYVGVTASDLEYQIIVDFTPGLNIPEIWANDIDWPYHLTIGLRKIDTLFTGLITISKTSCRTATTTVLSCTYSSTALTLTANSNGAISIDGVSLVANDRVLVKNQNTQTQNGIYFVSTVGDGTHPYILTRATDFNSSAYIKAGIYTIIEEGTVNADSCWVLTTNNPITLDSSNLIFKCAYFAKAEYAPMTSCTDPATNTVGTTAIVDTYSGNVVTLTTTGNSQTLQSPTDTRTGSKFTVINNDTSTNTLTVNGIAIPIGKAQTWIWDGTAWAEIDIGITTLPVPVIQGGTGLATIALGSILAANTLNVLSAITSTSGLKVLQNSDGVVSWGSTTGTGNIVFSNSPTLVTPALGTPSSGTLTNCTFPTLNQNTTGSAASLSISGQTGLLTFTGITSTNREKTVRNAADTILELGGSYTPTGTWNWGTATITGISVAGNILTSGYISTIGSTDLPIYPDVNSGTAGKSILLNYYSASGLGWLEAWRVNNVVTGYSNLVLMKDGGNVGIGTTSPGMKLDVIGSIRASQNIIFGDYSNSNTYGWRGISGIITLDAGGNYPTGWNFQYGANSALYINSSGNVGIGTTGPLSKLDVAWGGYTGAGSAIQIGADAGDVSTRTDATAKIGAFSMPHYNSASEEQVLLLLGYSPTGVNNIYIGGGTAAYNAATDIVFWTAANSTTVTGTEAMRIKSGNVGIGTTSPGSLLNLSKTQAGVETGIRIDNRSDTGIAGIEFLTGADADVGAGMKLIQTADGGAGRLAIYTGGSLDERISILNTNGNVGIGTTSPVSRLANYNSALSIGVAASGFMWRTTENDYAALIASQPSSGNSYGLRLHTEGNTADDAPFLVSSGTAPGTVNFIIKGTGNVGIGTTSPGAKLQINDNLNGTAFSTGSILKIVNTNGASEYAMIHFTDAVTSDAFIGYYSGASQATCRLALGGITEVLSIVNGNVGIGITSPGFNLEARANFSAGLNTTSGSYSYNVALGDSNQANNNRAIAIGASNIASGDGSMALGRGMTVSGGQSIGIGLYSSNSTGQATVSTANVMSIMGGNVGLGTDAFGTSAVNVLSIKNGTAPTSSPADMIQLYAEDVSSSSELKVRDEAGNVTTLSPHNFTLFQPDKSYVLPWSYYSRNDYVGKEINVDMYGVVKAVEELSGKKFMYIRDIPKSDWAANQEELRRVQDSKIKEAQDKVAVLTAKIDELTETIETLVGGNKKASEAELEGVSKAKKEIVVPSKYVTKPIPQWIADRLK
jgi:hypothetical protein